MRHQLEKAVFERLEKYRDSLLAFWEELVNI
jgi:hypothetical protein